MIGQGTMIFFVFLILKNDLLQNEITDGMKFHHEMKTGWLP